MSETLEIFDLIDGPCYCATSDGPCPYCDSMGNARSAVEALETTNEEQHTRGLELAKALSTCITAMNPPDKGGISMHEWNQRLKAATKQACAAFDGSPIAPAPEGSEK